MSLPKILLKKLNFLFFFSIMHPVNYHLTQKLTWMSRQLRSKNDAAELIDWISIMRSISNLLVGLSENIVTLQECPSYRKKLSISKHLGINCSTKNTNELALTNENPSRKQHRRVVQGKRTVELKTAEATSRETVITPKLDDHLKDNWTICSISAPPLAPETTVITGVRDDMSSVNDMEIECTEERDLLKHAIWHRLEEAGKECKYYQADPARIKKLSRIVDNDFNMKKDDLLRNNLREFFKRTMNEFFQNR